MPIPFCPTRTKQAILSPGRPSIFTSLMLDPYRINSLTQRIHLSLITHFSINDNITSICGYGITFRKFYSTINTLIFFASLGIIGNNIKAFFLDSFSFVPCIEQLFVFHLELKCKIFKSDSSVLFDPAQLLATQ